MARPIRLNASRRLAGMLAILAFIALLPSPVVAALASGAQASLDRAIPVDPASSFVDAGRVTGPERTSSASRQGALLVAFLPGTTAATQAADLASAGATVIRTYLSGAELLSVKPGDELTALRTIQARGHVQFVGLDYAYRESAVPNDPSFDLEWELGTTAAPGSLGTASSDEKALPAWSITTGSRSIVIAEVDSGVDYTHPDLAPNIWSNPGGIGGCPAGTHGYNVLTSRCDPMDDEIEFGGHGTHVAGIMGAVGDNAVGVAGINWTTTILPVKWLNSTGQGYTSDLIAALDWVLEAKEAGVNVRVVNDAATFPRDAPANMSGPSQLLSNEIDLLGKHGILFVAAAGNTGDNDDTAALRRYPCGYDRPTEICVTASDERDSLPAWANRGKTTVDLAAPGEHIYSTLRGGKYGYVSGGSMASAQVAGAAALILSARDMSVTALKADILNNVDRVPTLEGLVRSGGRLDICKAVPGCTVTDSAPSVNLGLSTSASPAGVASSPGAAPITSGGAVDSTAPSRASTGTEQTDDGPPGVLLIAVGLVILLLLGGVVVEVRRASHRG